MIRVTKMTGKFYGIELSDSDDEKFIEEVTTFPREGTPVILVEDLEDLKELGIYDDVIMVERED